MNNIKVVNEWILVQPEKNSDSEESVTPSGVVIPASAKTKEIVKKAKVVMISDDVSRLLKQEREDPEAVLPYKVGDTVLFYGKTGISIENNTYMFLKYDGMLAIEVEDEKF